MNLKKVVGLAFLTLIITIISTRLIPRAKTSLSFSMFSYLRTTLFVFSSFFALLASIKLFSFLFEYPLLTVHTDEDTESSCKDPSCEHDHD